MSKSLAQIAYDAYSEYLRWNFNSSLPTWVELPAIYREAWTNAAEDVATKVKFDLSDE